MSERDDLRERAEHLLRWYWREMRDAGPASGLRPLFRGALSMAETLKVFDADDVELWKRRVQTCPGHDDEGGRRWCAYCGDMPRDEDPSHD